MTDAAPHYLSLLGEIKPKEDLPPPDRDVRDYLALVVASMCRLEETVAHDKSGTPKWKLWRYAGKGMRGEASLCWIDPKRPEKGQQYKYMGVARAVLAVRKELKLDKFSVAAGMEKLPKHVKRLTPTPPKIRPPKPPKPKKLRRADQVPTPVDQITDPALLAMMEATKARRLNGRSA